MAATFSSLTLSSLVRLVPLPNGMSGTSAIERNNFNSGTASVNGNRQQGNNYIWKALRQRAATA